MDDPKKAELMRHGGGTGESWGTSLGINQNEVSWVKIKCLTTNECQTFRTKSMNPCQ